jgi:hypothetical protein
VSALIVLAAIVILAGVVVVAMGRGGELARDLPAEPAAGDFRTWSDVASYRPPSALLGYNAVATEHALSEIARAIAQRDAEIDLLRRRLTAAGLSRDDLPADGLPADDLPAGDLPADGEWQTVLDEADHRPAVLDPADQGPAE